ncbi:hypothetical protein AXF42_Ash004947 [Apostasia shenzhenica]|uniref:Uncharacterized protein n=1 Tax=Apostasia shenzhenica TaxID=1088818 RepID=A0A2I0B815_9ASPA|nr:hypothetical protein AXF42_Ash004947 [Apostasia shenzhenica]
MSSSSSFSCCSNSSGNSAPPFCKPQLSFKLSLHLLLPFVCWTLQKSKPSVSWVLILLNKVKEWSKEVDRILNSHLHRLGLSVFVICAGRAPTTHPRRLCARSSPAPLQRASHLVVPLLSCNALPSHLHFPSLSVVIFRVARVLVAGPALALRSGNPP